MNSKTPGKPKRAYRNAMSCFLKNNIKGSVRELFFSVFLLMVATAGNLSFAQSNGGLLDKKLTVHLTDVTLDHALKTIGEKAGCTFVYSNKLLNTSRKVSGNYNSQKLGDILQSLLGDLGKGVRVDGDQIYIRPATRAGRSSVLGKILSDKGEPAIGASVWIKETSVGTTADTLGKFEIDYLKAGTYTVQVSCVGYVGVTETVIIKENQRHILNLVIREDGKLLNDVLVVGKTEIKEIKESGFNVTAVNTAKFNNSTRDLNQILNNTTGIRIREQGGLGSNFSFSINGLSGKAVRFFVDGIPMENYGAGMSFNNIPANLANRMEVYKGVVPVELGADALGGAVNMVTNKGPGNYLDASYSYGSFNTHRAALSTQYKHEATGLLLKLAGFYNFSDNSYRMYSNPEYNAPIRVPDGNGGFVEKNLRRFHDQFKSAMLQGEAGYVNKKWADVMMLGLVYNTHYKQFQTGATQNVVYGKIDRRGEYFMPSIRYKKSDLFVKGLDATAFMSYGVDKYAVADTSTSTYWWDGSISGSNNNHGEFGAGTKRTLTHFKNSFLLTRANFSYSLNKHNSVTFNHTYSNAERVSSEELSNKAYSPAGQSKSVFGLSLQNMALNQKLKNTVFAKMYHFNLRAAAGNQAMGVVLEERDKSYNDFGYGLASRFALTNNIGIRLSYEHAYRLPEQVEVLGDGINVVANLDIKPESSHNLNLGGDFSFRKNKHFYSFDIAGFYRDATDFIYSIPAGNYTSQYLNEGKVRIIGGEAEAQYKYGDLLEVSVNASYQRSKQTQEFIYGTKTKYATYGNMIPNQPWLFGNAFFSIGKNNWLGKKSRVQFDWTSQYLHSFFLTWEAWGSSQSQNTIPKQLLHNAGITYSVKDGRYNVSVESRNVFNELAYDNFRLQKPGRSFSIKLRYFIQ